MKIAPSILSADFGCLAKQVNWFDKAGVEVLHLDIMDGHFVPNISFGPYILKVLRKLTKADFDVHLMVTEPTKFLNTFSECGADYLTFHIESVSQENSRIKVEAIINKIRRLNKKVGLSLNPKTTASNIYPYLPIIDFVLIMSVEPGFGGQEFISHTLRKIQMLRRYIDLNNYKCLISVDGGINESNIRTIANAGANIAVCGNSIFGKRNPKLAYVTLMRNILTNKDF